MVYLKNTGFDQMHVLVMDLYQTWIYRQVIKTYKHHNNMKEKKNFQI